MKQGKIKKTLSEIPENSIESAVSNAKGIERRIIIKGDTLSRILMNEVKITDKYLLRALIELKRQGVAINIIHIGAQLSVVKKDDNLFLTITNNKDNNHENIRLFVDGNTTQLRLGSESEIKKENTILKTALTEALNTLSVDIANVARVLKTNKRPDGKISVLLKTKDDDITNIVLDADMFTGTDFTAEIEEIIEAEK